MSGRVVSHVIHHGVHFMSQVSFVSPALLRGPVEKLQVLVLSVTVSRQIRGASKDAPLIPHISQQPLFQSETNIYRMF